MTYMETHAAQRSAAALESDTGGNRRSGRIPRSLTPFFARKGTLLLPRFAAVMLSVLRRSRRQDTHTALLVGLLLAGRMEARRVHAR